MTSFMIPTTFILAIMVTSIHCQVAIHGTGFQHGSEISNKTVPVQTPKLIMLDDLTKSDDNTLAMLSIAEGGRLSRCSSSGSTYLTLKNSTNTVNLIAQPSQYGDFKATQDSENQLPVDDIIIRYANHDTVSKVFPTTAVLFTNESASATVDEPAHFRLYIMQILDLVAESESDNSVTYRVDLKNVTAHRNNEGIVTATPIMEELFPKDSRRPPPLTFPSGSLMMDLIDVNDDNIDSKLKSYTLAHMAESGELQYQANKLAQGGDGLVSAHGVLSLWVLGPFSIPLYPAFIACCTASLAIWYLVQPFVFCCII